MFPKYFQWHIIGHERIQRYLQKSVISGKIFHAYVFSGDQHLGKNALATVFTQTLLCENSTRPCGRCHHCMLFQKSLHPDFHRIQSEREGMNISVQHIRHIHNKLSQTSFLTSYKAVIVEDAENLSPAAANALLKIVEEPPRSTLFIFITTSLFRIPVTLRSRCHVLPFSHVPSSVLAEHIRERSLSEAALEIGLSSEHILSLSDGKPGLALTFFDDTSAFENSLALAKKVVSLFQSRNVSRALLSAVQLLPKQLNGMALRSSVLNLLDVFTAVLRDVMLTQFGKSIKHTYMSRELSTLAHHFSQKNILHSFRAASEARKKILNYVNPKLVVEQFILETHFTQ